MSGLTCTSGWWPVAEEAIGRGAVQNPGELAGLLRLLGSVQPRCVVEIGTFRGGTLWAWCQVAAEDALIVSVDLPGGAGGGGYSEREAQLTFPAYARSGQRLVCLRADSHLEETVEEVEEALAAQPIDLLFVDGDHTYVGAKRDFELYRRFVRSGGLVAFHDIVEPDPGVTNGTRCEVHKLWDELASEFDLTFEFVDACGWGGIGVLVMP